MDSKYDPSKYENKIYSMWGKSGVFTPKIDKKKKPFTIILPLPNANDPMHMGHALFTIEDIMIRYHRMLGNPTLWLPGGDHAGIETQFVFEKKLAKENKSRFDFDRETLYKMIVEFTETNKSINRNQMKRLGFSMDWSRYHYSLEPDIVAKVLKTFIKLHADGLVYRGERIVNYCTFCGTAFSELEVEYKEKEDFLYYLDYKGITIATTRPETIFADVAIAVNPKDKRYKNLVGKNATIPLINLSIPIITDDNIDIKFGTGALKVTPAHDPLDFEIGAKHHLDVISVIKTNGQMADDPRVPHDIQGLYVNQAREKTLQLLTQSGLLIKKEPLAHSVGTCYKCGRTIEPLVIPQWFVKTKPLADKAIIAVKKGETKIFPKKRFEKLYFDWMENIRDWNISRQIVWGPRIPVWYNVDDNPQIDIVFIDKGGKRISSNLKDLLSTQRVNKYSFEEIEKGLQQLIAREPSKYIVSVKKPGNNYLQDTDTFDTWFLSGQWPLTTLGFNLDNPRESSEDFKYFYPTTVLDTLWDILFFWVGRMMMFGLYLTGKAPFKIVHLHSRVVDKFGKKMSKSKGNVVDPILMVDKYGADALRMALVMGIAPASDISISDEKIIGMRNFSNKIWNISRFIDMKLKDAGVIKHEDLPHYSKNIRGLTFEDKVFVKKLNNIIDIVSKGIENYKFGIASEKLYSFIWHDFADKYIESTKKRLNKNDKASLIVLRHTLFTCLKLLHPFAPFVTESIWQEMKTQHISPNSMLAESEWPKIIK